MPTNTLNANNLTNGRPTEVAVSVFARSNFVSLTTTQPRQDSTPKFGLIFTAAALTSGAAGLGKPVIAQTKNTLTAIPLTTQSPGLTALVGTLYNINSIIDYATASPLIDSSLPGLIISSLFNFAPPISIASGSAGLGKPALIQLQTITASNLAASGAGIGAAQFVQFQSLTAVNLAAGAAGIGTPGIGAISAGLFPQLTFASVDTNISQINAAVTGLAPDVRMFKVGTLLGAISSTAPGAAFLSVSAGIAIANKAVMAAASALAATAQQRTISKAALSAASILKANAATFIFDSEILSSLSTLGAVASQGKAIASSSFAVLNSITQAAILQSSTALLSGSTALLANLVFPITTTWFGTSKIVSTSTMSASATRTLAAAASFNTLSSLVSNLQLYISGSAFSPVSTIQAVATALQLIPTSLSNAVLLSVDVQLSKGVKASLSVSSSLSALLSIGRPLGVGLVPQAILASIANISGQIGVGLSPVTNIAATEIQQRSMIVGLSPSVSLNIVSQTRILPTVAFTAVSTLTVNERILPNGTAFYISQVILQSIAAQTMLGNASMPVSPTLIPHEGLLLMQSPVAISSSALMATKEVLEIGPNLTLISNIILSVPDLKNFAATGTELVGETEFAITYSFNESCAAILDNGSTMTMLPSAAVSGFVTMFTGCYFNIDITQQRTVEQGPVIIARQPGNRIVAQGNLVILNS